MMAFNQPLIDKNIERFDPRSNSEREELEEQLNMISEDLDSYTNASFGSQQTRVCFRQNVLKTAADIRQDLCAGRSLTFNSAQRDIAVEAVSEALDEALELPGYRQEGDPDIARDFLAQAVIDALVSTDL